MKKLLWAIILCLACGACVDDSLDSDLDRAAALVDSLPDSAYAVLEATPWPEIRSERQRARYGLIATQALTSLYMEPDNDSMVSAALAYYDSPEIDEPAQLAKALYYTSLSKSRIGNTQQAIAYAMRARDIADSIGLPAWSGRAWSELGQLFAESFDYYHAINSLDEAAKRHKKSGLLKHYCFSMIDKASLLGTYGFPSDGLETIDSLRAEHIPMDSETQDYSFVIRGNLLNQNGKSQEALGYLDSISENSEYKTDPLTFQQYLEIRIPTLIKLGLLHEADSLINILATVSSEKDIDLAHIKYSYFKTLDQTDSAMYYLEKHMEALYDQTRETMANSALSGGLDYYKTQYRIKDHQHSENRKKSIRIFIVSFVLVLLIGFIVSRRIKEQQRELTRRMDDISALSEDTDNMRQRMIELEQKLQGNSDSKAAMAEIISLYSEQVISLDKLIASYAYDSSLPGKTPAKDISMLIDRMFSPKYFNTLENALNRAYSNLITELRENCTFVSEEQIRISNLIILGFGSKTICTIFDISASKLHTSKTRMKTRILESGWSRAEEYCAMLEIKRRPA